MLLVGERIDETGDFNTFDGAVAGLMRSSRSHAAADLILAPFVDVLSENPHEDLPVAVVIGKLVSLSRQFCNEQSSPRGVTTFD